MLIGAVSNIYLVDILTLIIRFFCGSSAILPPRNKDCLNKFARSTNS